MKNITSKDPRKPAIVAMLKQKSGGTKVTLLKEVHPGVYQGSCLRYVEPTDACGRSLGAYHGQRVTFETIGTFVVTAQECGVDAHVVKCIYCGAVVPDVPVPSPAADEPWARLARQHKPRCEWIRTRAHSVDEVKL